MFQVCLRILHHGMTSRNCPRFGGNSTVVQLRLSRRNCNDSQGNILDPELLLEMPYSGCQQPFYHQTLGSGAQN